MSMVKICHKKKRENMDLSCLVLTIQLVIGGVMLWRMFSSDTRGLLVPSAHDLNATTYLVAKHVHSFMTIVYPSSPGYFHQDNVL